MNQRDRVLLFDLGGVLIENTGRAGLTSLLPYTLGEREIWGKWLESPAVRDFEAGRISPESFAGAFISEWRLNVGPEEFIEAFASWPKGFFPGARELLHSLRPRHRLACLSNTNVIHWSRFPDFSSVFDSCFASHEMGLLKPDREAYAHVLERLAVPADSVFFFDDLAPNVEAARAFGIRAFQVAGFDDITPVLREHGLV